MASKFLTEKLLAGLQVEEDEDIARDNGRIDAKESITLADSRDPTESRAEIKFSFKKPVRNDQYTINNIISSVQGSIVEGDLGVMERILGQIGLAPAKGKSKVTSTVSTNIGKYSRYRKQKSDQALRDGKGKFISEINLRNALKLATIANVVQDMKSPTAQLKYQTGRFQYSIDLKPLTLKNDTLSIFFTYMVRPYSVFDPQVSSYRGLSSNQRNPQKLITDQLQKQATQLGIRRYKLDIKQHWRRSG